MEEIGAIMGIMGIVFVINAVGVEPIRPIGLYVGLVMAIIGWALYYVGKDDNKRKRRYWEDIR